MDIQRNLLTISLVAISAILYFKWIDYSALDQTANVPTEVVDSGVPTTPQSEQSADDIPSIASDSPEAPINQVQTDPASIIVIETDIVRATINTKGGVIESLELKKNPISLDQPGNGFPLLQKTTSETFVSQDGLISPGNLEAPSHNTQYQSTASNYSLDGQDQVIVPLTWRSDAGVEFVKTLTFSKDSYLVNIDYSVRNNSGEPWVGYFYGQLNRSIPEDTGGGFGRLPIYVGGAYYTLKEKYQKIGFDDFNDKHEDNALDDLVWVGMLQHYFVGAWIPGEQSNVGYSSINKAQGLYRIGYKTTSPVRVENGEVGKLSSRVYLGSKEHSRLTKLEDEGVEDFDLLVDYGKLTVIADPLFFVLNLIHDVVGNWGWSIILLTILIKLAFYPLSAASYRSMGKMKKLQPRMATLKERYKDDRQKFQMEMMALYKKEKVNPAGGCLPILIQIPVFIALYYVLLESVEMRHAPFALWWVDLSAKDPYYVLPILMGISMFLMQKLTPTPMDDIQKKVMMIMPFALTFLFMSFPQGLVLYWVVNNVLTMAQQWFNYRQQEQNA